MIQAITLLFIYDNIDLLAKVGYPFHFKDIMFWVYFGSRCLITYLVWVLIDTQNLLAEIDDVLIGVFLFFFMVGLVQNFTLKLGAYDIGGLLKVFSGLRDRVLDNANLRVKDKEKNILTREKSRQREVQMKLEAQHSLQELKQILHGAFAYANFAVTKRDEEMKKLEQLTQGHTDKYNEPYYAAKIIYIGGIEFAEQYIN